MTDLDLAIGRSKRLESLLRELGGSGRGLHELTSSLDRRRALPGPLVKKLRFVATVRNKIVHDLNYTKIDDRAGFKKACDEAERELRQLVRGRPSVNTAVFVVVAIVSFLLSGIVATVWLLYEYGVFG